jgi:hypothetical protein
VDTFYDLPGVYMARIVATLENCDMMSSSNARDLPSFVVRESPLVNFALTPRNEFVASCDGSALAPVRVNACRNCQRVDCQLQPLVTGMTYKRNAILFPLRTRTEIKVTQHH